MTPETLRQRGSGASEWPCGRSLEGRFGYPHNIAVGADTRSGAGLARGGPCGDCDNRRAAPFWPASQATCCALSASRCCPSGAARVSGSPDARVNRGKQSAGALVSRSPTPMPISKRVLIICSTSARPACLAAMVLPEGGFFDQDRGSGADH